MTTEDKILEALIEEVSSLHDTTKALVRVIRDREDSAGEPLPLELELLRDSHRASGAIDVLAELLADLDPVRSANEWKDEAIRRAAADRLLSDAARIVDEAVIPLELSGEELLREHGFDVDRFKK